MSQEYTTGLRAAGSYLVAYNCVAATQNRAPIIRLGKELEETLGGKLDSRLNIVSFDNTMDAVEYFNYFNLLAESANQKLLAKDYMAGRFVALLDSGFVPYYMPPTFFDKRLKGFFIEAIKRSGVSIHEYRAMNFDGQFVHSESETDIWVSKMEAADYLGVPIKDFVTLKFIQEVMRRCAG